MQMPEMGEWVMVWPSHKLVQEEGIFGRWLPMEGKRVQWSDWYHRRWMEGVIFFEFETEKQGS